MLDAITYAYNRITEAAEIKAQTPSANIKAGCRVILEVYGYPDRDDVEILLGIAYDTFQRACKNTGECLLNG